MKQKNLSLFLFCITSTFFSVAQTLIKTDKESYRIDGSYDFMITKKDLVSDQYLFQVKTNIPDKKQKESYHVLNNDASFTLAGETMFIIYDVWQKSTSSKECYVLLMNTKTGEFGQKKLLYSTPLNSSFSAGNIRYWPVFSPDFSKVAVIKDNKSKGYDIDSEITIYDAKTLNAISSKKIGQTYNGQKRVLDKKMDLDNNGNISLIFNVVNEETGATAKSFSAEIPFNDRELKNIKPLESAATASESTHGRFYKTLQDYIDGKPIKGLRIKDDAYSWGSSVGSKFVLLDDDGNIIKQEAEKVPSDIFTYKGYLMRLIDKTPYIVLTSGKLCFYSEYAEQQKLYMTEGWDGKLEGFKERKLEDYLEKYNLLEDYKKDKPKREFSDNVNSYFNKTLAWQIDYINKLNKKM